MIALLLACSGATVQVEDDSRPTVDTAPEDPPGLDLCLNELMPRNESSAVDEAGEVEDWIELYNPGAEPVVLDGWTLVLGEQVAALDGEVIAPGEFALFWADGQEGSRHLDFKLPGEGGELRLVDRGGDSSVLRWGQTLDDFSVARTEDCCTGEGCLGFQLLGTPGRSNLDTGTDTPTYEEVPILAKGSTWRYFDGPQAPAGWSAEGFDDSAWASGAGPLGYGDGHIVTTLSYGGNDAAKHMTAWFRIEFEASGVAELTRMRARVLRDDGLVLTLNGTEMFRDNLPEGELSASTPASSSTGGGAETTYGPHTMDLGPLREGKNLIAVEVHQSAPDSSDLGFDMELVGLQPVE